MIFYFSATGNSKAVAKALERELGDRAVSITDFKEPCPSHNAAAWLSLGIVFPVYGWNPPSVVYEFLDNLFCLGVNTDYLYLVATCGDDIGTADKRMYEFLRSHNMKCNSAFSITMPNTYVCLPGFDVDKEDVRQNKLAGFHDRITYIASQIKARNHTVSVNRGAFPRIKTGLLGWLFAKFLMTDRYFHTTSTCALCKKCITVCPRHNISISYNKIMWNKNCSGCLACYHHCPHRAVRFGVFSDNKGQYCLDKYRQELKI